MKADLFRKNDKPTDLAKLLNNQETPIETILSDSQFAYSVRSESKAFLHYFYPTKEMDKPQPTLTHLNELLDYALSTNKINKKKYRLLQLNRNAANFLAHNFTKFLKLSSTDPSQLVINRLKNFMYDTKSNKHPVICGHFQRIIENYFRNHPQCFQTPDDTFSLDKFADFIIENAYLLPYRTLLSDLLCDFNELFNGLLQEKVLLHAARLVLSISSLNSNTLKKSHQFSLSSALKSQLYTPDKLQSIQPINILEQPIPLPDFLMHDLEAETMGPIILNNAFFTQQKRKVHYDKFDETRYTSLTPIILHVYSLLTAIRLGSVANTEIIKNFQNENSIRLLLICGVYCDSNSQIAPEAFRLLRYVLYGYDDIDGMNEIPSIIDDFAATFAFDPDSMTTQMFAAFPIFWNYRYETVESFTTRNEDVYKPLDPKNFSPEVQKTYPLSLLSEPYIKPPGKTPLELLTPLFLSEPPLNTIFNIRFMEILERLGNDRKKIIGDETDVNNLPIEQQQKILKLDLIYFEFLRNKFDLNQKDHNLNLLEALPIVTPLVSTNEFFHPNKSPSPSDERAKVHRAPANGQILQIFEFIFETQLLDQSDTMQSAFYDLMPERNQVPLKYFKQRDNYKKLMEKIKKNAIILHQTPSFLIDDEVSKPTFD